MAPIQYAGSRMEDEKDGLEYDLPMHSARRRRTPSSKLVVAILLLGTILLTAWKWDGIRSRWGKEHGVSKRPMDCGYKAPKKNVWSDLDEEEFDDVLKFLYTVPNDLNLTKSGEAGPWDNHIAIIETLVPNKTDAVHYIDSDSAPPARYARVIINRGAAEQAGIDEYMVGPLPASKDTTITSLSWMYNSNRSSVKNPLPNVMDIVAWFSALGGEVADMIEDLLGADVVNPGHLEHAPPLMAMSRPAAFENGTISSWARVHSPGLRMDAWSLLAQGMFCRFEITGRDSSNWHIREWYYDGKLYNSTAAFRTAWKAGEVKKLPVNKDGSWTDSAPDVEGHPDREGTAPVMIQPGGPRYKLDKIERHVSWMGWEFYVNAMQAIGLGLWDVKFGGERILYELGLQEAMAHYAGRDPLAVGMYWLDTLFGMGVNSYELVPGYDCPAYATFLPMTFHQGDSTVTRNNAICIFEWTAAEALQRHTTPTHVTVSRNTHLIVRQVATVGNYDYTISYFFYLDGSMKVKVQASGYIFGAYNALEGMRSDFSKRSDASSYDYGYQIHEFVASSMHDHEINFKADFDIAGTANTLRRINVVPEHKTYDWEQDVDRSTMHLTTTEIEKESGLDWPANSGALYVVANKDVTNKWGENKGYHLKKLSANYLTIRNSTAMAKSANWAYHDLWVVKHHDEERRSASEYNAMEPEDPLIDFDLMVDDKDTIQEDLVVYFNLGTHHVPQSGDVPNTLMHWASSSVMFTPFNFHDRDPSRHTAQGVKLTMKDKKKGGGSYVEYFGGVYDKVAKVPVDMLEPDLSGYSAPEKVLMDLNWNSTLAAL